MWNKSPSTRFVKGSTEEPLLLSERHWLWVQSPGLPFISWAAAAAAKLLQSCPPLCDPTDGSPPGSPVPGILQARTLEWVAISFPYAWKWKVKVKSLSHVWLFVTPWTVAYQAPPSMGFSRQEYWSGVPFPSPTNCAAWAQCLSFLICKVRVIIASTQVLLWIHNFRW